MSMAPRSLPSSMWSRGSKPSAAKSRGRADRLEHDVVVLAAGRGVVVGEVGQRQQGVLPGLVRVRLRGLERLDLGGQRLGADQQLLLLLALRLRDLLAERLLLAALGLELDDRRPPRRVGRERHVDDVRGQPALALGRTDTVGVVTEDARVDHVAQAIRGDRQGSSEIRHRGSRQSYLRPCSTDPAACSSRGPRCCFALFGLITAWVVQDWGPLVRFDDRGDPAQQWAADSDWLRAPAAGGRGRSSTPSG